MPLQKLSTSCTCGLYWLQSTSGVLIVCTYASVWFLISGDIYRLFMCVCLLCCRQIIQPHGGQFFVGYIGLAITSVLIQAKSCTDDCRPAGLSFVRVAPVWRGEFVCCCVLALPTVGFFSLSLPLSFSVTRFLSHTLTHFLSLPFFMFPCVQVHLDLAQPRSRDRHAAVADRGLTAPGSHRHFSCRCRGHGQQSHDCR